MCDEIFFTRNVHQADTLYNIYALSLVKDSIHCCGHDVSISRGLKQEDLNHCLKGMLQGLGANITTAAIVCARK